MKKKADLMTSEEVLRALKRMSHQIIEKNKGVDNVVVIGIVNGGIPVANKLAGFLEEFEGVSVPVGSLNISNHRDDIEKNAALGSASENSGISDIPCDITDKDVILVDDVLYKGRTARAAFDALSDFGRAGSIQLAVLVDRGHRELPIRADYVGKNVPTSHSEKIVVELDSNDELSVSIFDL